MTHPTADSVADTLAALRETTPLVQSLTNIVSANFVTNVISSLIGATGGAVLYTELRRVREGATPNALAAIFD